MKAAEAGEHVLVDNPSACVVALQAISDEVQEARVILLDVTHRVHSVRAGRPRSM